MREIIVPRLARQPDKAERPKRSKVRAIKSPAHTLCLPSPRIVEVKLHLFHPLKNYYVLDMQRAAHTLAAT
ncbi:MAG: hypothetical protein ABI284_08755 [Nitrosospira sp.]